MIFICTDNHMAQQGGSRTHTTLLLGEGPAMMFRSGTVVSLSLGVRLPYSSDLAASIHCPAREIGTPPYFTTQQN